MQIEGAAPAPGRLGVGQRNWMLFILTLVGVCSSTDRAIISTVLEPIKREFGLADAQLGLLSGLAFASTYVLVVVPAGALADRMSRRKLIAGALAFWSLMTALCGAAQNFAQLLLTRMGVGAGEGGGHAATLSAVGDLFPPERRATAISIYYLNTPVAMLLAGVGGGLLTAAYGWRVAMAAAAAPGVLLALVLLFSPEPPREGATVDRAAAVKPPPFGEALRFLMGQRALVHLIIGVGLLTTVISGQGAFSYAFFMRQHGMSLKELGPILGAASAAIATVTILTSGLLSDFLAKRDPSLRLWLIVAALLVATPLVILGYLAPQPYALALYLVHVVVTGVWMGPGFATAQNLAPGAMRATVSSILFVVNGLVGVGFGPVITGLISDAWSTQFGAGGLRASLVATTALGLWAALHFYLSTRTLERDLARAEGWRG